MGQPQWTGRRGGTADVVATYRAFSKLADDLELSLPERLRILGGMSRTTYRRRLDGQSSTFKSEEEQRLGLFFAICKEAGGVYGDSKRWLCGGHLAHVFGGRPPLTLMVSGRIEGLQQTYDHLRDIGGGWV